MVNLEGMKIIFTVVKNEDLDKYVHPEMKDAFITVAEHVYLNKSIVENKKPNTYLVINTDEPYANEVIDIMKHHGHWG